MSITTKHHDSKESATHHHVREGIEHMKKDARNIKDDLHVLKEDTAQLGSHAASHAIDAAKSGVQGATDVAGDAYDSMKSYQDRMNKQIRAHPTTSILLALGAGVVIGRVLSAARR